MDSNLRSRLRAGDPDAFGVLFDSYARAVYNLGFRLTGNWSAAEEVVSLTFLEAWRLRGRIEPGYEPLRPWLLGIAVNMSRNLARAARRHQAALSRLPPPPPGVAGDCIGCFSTPPLTSGGDWTCRAPGGTAKDLRMPVASSSARCRGVRLGADTAPAGDGCPGRAGYCAGVVAGA